VSAVLPSPSADQNRPGSRYNRQLSLLNRLLIGVGCGLDDDHRPQECHHGWAGEKRQEVIPDGCAGQVENEQESVTRPLPYPAAFRQTMQAQQMAAMVKVAMA
jgi:hypothetical protein